MIPTLILAAGASSRMGGRDKLLELIDGTPILRRQVTRALETGPALVTLPSDDHARCHVVPRAARIVFIKGTMSGSIRAGINALPNEATGVIILPADMPDVTAQDIRSIRSAAQTSDAAIVRAVTPQGQFGHPIYFSKKTFHEFSELSGDRGAARLCGNWADSTRHVTLDGNRARLDLDTPDDWDRYRAGLTR